MMDSNTLMSRLSGLIQIHFRVLGNFQEKNIKVCIIKVKKSYFIVKMYVVFKVYTQYIIIL